MRKILSERNKSTTFTMLIGVSLFVLQSCTHTKPKVERAFYYWKSSEYSLLSEEKTSLNTLEVNKLYIKFFEVEKDAVFGNKPIAKLNLHLWNYPTDHVSGDDLNTNKNALYEIVPTVFIKNNVFYEITSNGLDSLADNVFFLINKYYNDKFNPPLYSFSEIQIDCDWTLKTKLNYFSFLSKFKTLSGKKLSCTLRLYPYKYRKTMGIPPVDKVTLMCYNLINPLENKEENSIQNNNELEKYLKKTKKYPLHLDIALPVFSWLQVFQNNQFVGILNYQDAVLKNALEKVKPLWYSVNADIEIENFYLRKGDIVKFEEVTEEETMETIRLLKKYISFNETITVTLFHLDENNLKHFKNETLTSFYTNFSR